MSNHPVQRVVSSLAMAILQRSLDEGKSISIPSLGIVIEPKEETMTISARIASVSVYKGRIHLMLAYYQGDRNISVGERDQLLITSYTRVPLVGQQIWGNAGHVVIEAGCGGERIMYARQGSFLREQEK